MASLKEIRSRINTVNNTIKITSAMRMISSAKLHRAQNATLNMIPYKDGLNEILKSSISDISSINSPFVEKREPKRVAITVVSSNNSLCGAFNSNIIKFTKNVLAQYKHLDRDNIILFTIGKKLTDAFINDSVTQIILDQKLCDKPSYESSKDISERLLSLYLEKKVDKVELIYTHFKTTATQILNYEILLPISFDQVEVKVNDDFIFEPDKNKISTELIDRILKLKVFIMLLDSSAAEHAARTVAMQLATENAKKIIQQLTVSYNKSRQQSITNELLDIMGGLNSSAN